MRVVILAGGMGTRIRAEFPDVPKPLIPVCGTPFLERQIKLLSAQGFDRFTFCVGYRAPQIIEYFGTGAAWKVNISYSTELSPLGTAGALKLAASLFSEALLVLNGDTYLDIDYREFIASRDRQASNIVGTVALVKVPNCARFGAVRMIDDGRIVAFDEKAAQQDGPGLINAGVYVLEPQLLDFIPGERPSSLEREVFPVLAAAGRLGGVIVEGTFVDIGTPAGYAELVELLAC